MNSTKELKWQVWIHDEKQCRKDFDAFLKRNSLKKEQETKHLSKSHAHKMEYNLLFVQYLERVQDIKDF